MIKKKKVLLSIIIIAMFMGVVYPLCFVNQQVATAQDHISTSDNIYSVGTEHFDNYDILIAAAMHLSYKPTKNVRPVKIIPLYNLSDGVIAYDVTFTDGSYLVVNANRQNPIIIEYAESRTNAPQDNGKNYYLAPMAVFQKESVTSQQLKAIDSDNRISIQSQELIKAQDEFAEMLSVKNEVLSNKHSTIKTRVQNYLNEQKGNNSDVYDDIILTGIPSGTITTKLINRLEDLTRLYGQGCMGAFEDLQGVKNHCAATSAYNMVFYYKFIMGDYVSYTYQYKVELFKSIHKYIKNGPVVASEYRARLKKYLNKETNYKYSIEKLNKSWNTYKNEIDNNRMCLLFLLPNIFNGHFVNGVGTTIYDTGATYCVIFDNWVSANRFMLLGSYVNSISKIYIYK